MLGCGGRVCKRTQRVVASDGVGRSGVELRTLCVAENLLCVQSTRPLFDPQSRERNCRRRSARGAVCGDKVGGGEAVCGENSDVGTRDAHMDAGRQARLSCVVLEGTRASRSFLAHALFLIRPEPNLRPKGMYEDPTRADGDEQWVDDEDLLIQADVLEETEEKGGAQSFFLCHALRLFWSRTVRGVLATRVAFRC